MNVLRKITALIFLSKVIYTSLFGVNGQQQVKFGNVN